MNTFKAPISVWISQYSHHDAASLQTVSSADGLVLWEGDQKPMEGYTKIGKGEVTITIASRDEIVTGKVDSLRADLAKDRAESQVRQNALMQKISELEALTYEAAQ
jgi:hypothetical protein